MHQSGKVRSNTSTNERTILYNHSGGLFFDEKNKRFADMKSMDPITKLNYAGTFYNVRNLNKFIMIFYFFTSLFQTKNLILV